ncbi:ABC transporter substrate-binding protein [Peptoniphilus gorbachii]|uniref:Corrinoid ABC transporter substrate-binding protein n=1 Tax=Peptoniphilus gorbachii TaxID=411567 RepID=A0A6N2Z8I6_9FIRM
MKNLKLKKFLSLLLVFTLFAGILGGCGKKDATEKNAEAKNVSTEEKVATKDEAGSHIVTDHAGHEVEVPNKIEKIVIDQVPILSTYMAYNEGKAPYIVGYAGSLKQVISGTVLKDMAPELLDATNTVQGQSDLNVEEIMKLKPDVIFYNAKNQDRYEKLSKTGVPCIGFVTMGADTPADPINRYGEWLKLLEDVFNEKGKMDDFLKAGDEIVKDVEERIAKVADEKRPSGMILWKYQEGTPIVAGKGTFGDFWLKRLRVKNVAADAKGYAKVNVEQIYAWNPDVFYLDGPGLLNIKTEDVYNNSVEGFDFSNLKSVKDKRVYNSKLGMWNWLTPNPDAPLVLAWLASETYPDAFKDYDLKKVIKDYYQKWYNYKLSDEQIEDMFNI